MTETTDFTTQYLPKARRAALAAAAEAVQPAAKPDEKIAKPKQSFKAQTDKIFRRGLSMTVQHHTLYLNDEPVISAVAFTTSYTNRQPADVKRELAAYFTMYR